MRSLTTITCLCLFGISGTAQIPQIPQIPPGKVRWIPPDPDTERVDNKVRDEVGPPDVDLPAAADERDPTLLPVTLDAVGYPSTIPTRFEPGQQGKLVITMVLKDHVVITPDTPIELHYLAQQGVVSLGPHTLRPAKQNMDDGPLFAEMVYDGSAVFEVPIQIAANAKPGEHRAAVRAEFELKDARSGFSMGRFRNSIPVKVRVVEPASPARGGAGTGAAPIPGLDSPAASAQQIAERVALDGVLRDGDGAGASPLPGDPGQPRLPGGSVEVPVSVWVLGGLGALALLASVVLILSRIFRS